MDWFLSRWSRLGRLQLVKLFVSSLLATFLLKRFLEFRKQTRETYKLALALPHEPIPESVGKYSLDLNGTFKRNFKGGFKHFSDISDEMIPFIEKMRKKFPNDGLFLVWVMNYNISPIPVCTIFVTDIEIIREICKARNAEIFEKPQVASFLKDLYGDSVLVAPHVSWKEQRRVLDKGFSDSLMKNEFPKIREVSKELVKRLGLKCRINGEGYEVEVVQEMRRATLDILGKVSFSYEVGCLQVQGDEKPLLHEAFDTITSTLVKRFFSPTKQLFQNFPTAENRKLKKAVKFLNKTVMDIIKKRNIEGIASEPRDVLDVIMQDRSLSDKQVLDNIKTILFAGQDTTAATLSWGFYLLAKHPKVVEKLRQELASLGDDYSIEDIEECDYLNAVILEILRLYPAAGTGRVASKATKVGKYVIPPKVDIYCFSYTVQRDEKYYEKVNEFIPERWIDKYKEKISLQAKMGKISRGSSEAFMPFSLGNRNCVGRKLATLELRVIMIEVLKSLDVFLPESQPSGFSEVPCFSFTVTPKDLHLVFKIRNA